MKPKGFPFFFALILKDKHDVVAHYTRLPYGVIQWELKGKRENIEEAKRTLERMRPAGIPFYYVEQE